MPVAAAPNLSDEQVIELLDLMKGADSVARDLIRQSVQMVFRQYFPSTDFKSVIDWFETGGNLKFSDTDSSEQLVKAMNAIHGLLDKSLALGVTFDSPLGLRAAAGEMILEGLHSIDKISRSEERGYASAERRVAAQDLYRDYGLERNRHKKPLN